MEGAWDLLKYSISVSRFTCRLHAYPRLTVSHLRHQAWLWLTALVDIAISGLLFIKLRRQKK